MHSVTRATTNFDIIWHFHIMSKVLPVVAGPRQCNVDSVWASNGQNDPHFLSVCLQDSLVKKKQSHMARVPIWKLGVNTRRWWKIVSFLSRMDTLMQKYNTKNILCCCLDYLIRLFEHYAVCSALLQFSTWLQMWMTQGEEQKWFHYKLDLMLLTEIHCF